jgi:hypothetical protein
VAFAAKHAANPWHTVKFPHYLGNPTPGFLHQILRLHTPCECRLFGAFHFCASDEHLEYGRLLEQMPK